MKGKSKWLILGIGAFITISITIALMGVHYKNAAIRLETQASAQKDVLEANFDKMWKVIKDNAGIVDKYKGDFKEIYVGIMEGRYGTGGSGSQGGQFMLWIKEHNPQFDSSVYSKLMTSVEANRETFFYEQKKLRSIKEQHDNMRLTWPASIVCSGRPEIKVVIISSTKTKQVMETGLDEHKNIFDK
ncbi:MAG: hypothetical protein ACFFG0_00695 [Candidatus Thorarchaeota archaeon]